MQVARNELDDVREPVLPDRGNDVHRNLILNVLPVSLLADLSRLDVAFIDTLGVEECVVLFLA